MEKSDYMEMLRKRLDEQIKYLSSLSGTSYAKPQTALDIWRFVLDIKTLSALAGADYQEMINHYGSQTGLRDADIKSYAVIGEWIALDRSTRDLDPDDYDDFWGNPENQPNILCPPEEDSESESLLELLNEMWKL
jgi:hypothetical protein